MRIDKRMFFDRKRVIDATDRATRRVLSRFGAFVRQTARRSIRRRKRPSRPGQPPSSHVGLLRDRIFFGYDRERQSVVIGPAPINQRSPYGTTTVPELLEEGGRVRRREPGGRTKTLNYRARPFMG
ncbi:MAG: hypothetical protein WDZ31_04660, partial [Phycisphaeraceae bacterium]